MKLFHHALLVAIAIAASACTVTGYNAVVPFALPGVRVRPEVARGYAAYGATLAAWGTWYPHADHGAVWCPGPGATGELGAPFQPYVSGGRWAFSDDPSAGAPAGSPTWKSELPGTWSEITSHHGWWVRVASDGPSPWCWVPGAEETPARVTWRLGDGFVGWAPDPPFWIVCDDVDSEDMLDWAFTLLGTLLERDPGQNLLSGDAKDRARTATTPVASADGSFKRNRVGPSGESVSAARKLLAEYVVAHPDAITATSAGSKKSGSGGAGSKGSSSAKSRVSSEKPGEAPPLPDAMAYYDAFAAQPMVGPVGLAPQVRASEPSAAGRQGALGSATAALEGHGAASRHASSSSGGHASSGKSKSSKGKSSKSKH
jgi:hypothetical protein